MEYKELYGKIYELTESGEIEEGIKEVEKNLLKYKDTIFHKMVGRNILDSAEELTNYLSKFIDQLEERIELKSVYIEMNGFSINYDLWYIDFFGYEIIGDTENIDWLGDWNPENSSKEPFTIKGLEDLQKAYEEYDEKELFEEEINVEIANVCELLITLRLQELFKEVVVMGRQKNKTWSIIPFFISSHGSEMLYKI